MLTLIRLLSDLGLSVMSAMSPAMMDGTDRDRKTQAKIYTRARIFNKPARNEDTNFKDINIIIIKKMKNSTG